MPSRTAPMTARIALTYRDYEALPNDGKRYEIHDGELYVTAAPTSDHQIVLTRLLAFLHAHVEARQLGIVLPAPLDVILADTTILQPDIVYIDRQRRSSLAKRGMEGPPTLAIEILSPTTAVVDRGAKRHLYARYGVPYFWIVDLEARAVEAYELRGPDYICVATAAGPQPTDLPPFGDLGLVPDGLWP
jgi:Uma2 family endonuclease